MDPTPPFSPPPPARAAAWMKGTAGKAFLIMMLALLPLAISTIIVNWHSIRTTEQEKQELLIAATRQNAAQLAATVTAIQTAQSLTANVLADNPADTHICDRLQHLFNAMTDDDGLLVAIFDRRGEIRCRSENAARLAGALRQAGQDAPEVLLVPDLDGLLIRSASRDGSVTALALYLRPALAKLTSDVGNGADQTITLHQGDIRLVLASSTGDQSRSRARLNAHAPVTPDRTPALTGDQADRHQLVLDNEVIDTLTSNARMISLLMPLLLWVAAVFLGWLVVHWLLIKPLTTLRREIAAYTPGKIIRPPHLSRLASSEIEELGETFHRMSQEVARHEEGMRAALERQTRLTREVHHRVKNNLQIISSLISLHWRAAEDANEGDAYLSIQRRVDALAVVQRNHYAELDEELGLRARPMMNEIASALKISAKVQSGRNIDIAVDCDDVMLHQDVATAIAFMTAELADLVIAYAPDQRFTISLLRLDGTEGQARFSLVSPIFRQAGGSEPATVRLYERVLAGLARQLRTPLGHDAEAGEYHITIPVTG